MEYEEIAQMIKERIQRKELERARVQAELRVAEQYHGSVVMATYKLYEVDGALAELRNLLRSFSRREKK